MSVGADRIKFEDCRGDYVFSLGVVLDSLKREREREGKVSERRIVLTIKTHRPIDQIDRRARVIRHGDTSEMNERTD